jgi:hypothetical protein
MRCSIFLQNPLFLIFDENNASMILATKKVLLSTVLYSTAEYLSAVSFVASF